MNTVSIVRAAVVRPTGFGSAAALRIVLADDANTARSYTRPASAGETVADLAGEARAIETQGGIDRAELDAQWTLSRLDDDRDQVEAETSAIFEEGYAPELEEIEEERAPLQ